MSITVYDFDKLSPAEKMKQFHSEHGSECLRDGHNPVFYYADGAMLEGEGDLLMTVYIFVPDATTVEGEYQLYWRKRKFAQLKLARAVGEFDNLNTQLAN